MAGGYWARPLRHGCLPELDKTAPEQPARGGHDGAVPSLAFIRFLAAGAELRDLRPLDQRLDHTHLIAYCADRGISKSPVPASSIARRVEILGAAGSGWMCDRFNPRVLLFWYYGLRGLSLSSFRSPNSMLSACRSSRLLRPRLGGNRSGNLCFVQPAFRAPDAPIIISWIFAAHQIGGAIAAFGAGAVRSFSGDYLLAFMTSGLACLLAALLVLRVNRPAAEIVHAV